ncbi:MAG: hypothetical protein HY608_03700 [Planctomycetes bacterium]|nr:hypothetical protein [Planctomycetota bacterium]
MKGALLSVAVVCLSLALCGAADEPPPGVAGGPAWPDTSSWPEAGEVAARWARWAIESGSYAALVERDAALAVRGVLEGPAGSDWEVAVAEALRRTGRDAEGERRLRERLAADEGDVRVRAALGEHLALLGRLDDAASVLAPLGAVDRNAMGRRADGEELLGCGRGLLRLGDLTGDAKHVKAAFEWAFPHARRAMPGDPRVPVAEARQLLAAGQRIDAREALREALEANAKCPEALYLLGRYEVALDARPGWEEARLAIALKHMGIDIGFADLLRPEPGEGGGDGAPFMSEEVFDPKPEDDRIVQEQVDAALALNPRSAAALSVAAAQKYLLGDEDAFQALSERAWAVDPTCGDMFYWLSERAANPRDLRPALAWARKCLERNPRHLRALLGAGLCCMNEGLEGEGHAFFTEAWRLYPFHVVAYNYLKLLDSYPEQFTVVETGHFRIRIRQRESDLVLPEAVRSLEGWYAELKERYGFEPELPVKVELFDDKQDFAVRTLGLPGAPYAGVCLGRVVTCQSAGALAFEGECWSETLYHELVHIFTTQMAAGRMSRWYAEGMSTWEERRRHGEWEWEENVDQKLSSRIELGMLDAPPLTEEFKQDPRFAYHHASLICEYIEFRFGVQGHVRILAEYAKGCGARTPMAEMLLAWTGRRDPDVIQTALGITLEDLDKGFREWVRGRLPEPGVLPILYPRNAIGPLREAYASGRSPDVGARLARALFQNGAKEEARTLAEPLVGRLLTAPVDVYVLLGHLAFDEDRFGEARERYERAFALGGKDFYATFSMGRMAEMEEQDEEAERWYRLAQERFPRSVYDPYHTYRALGKVYRRLGQSAKEREQTVRWLSISQGDLRTRRWLLPRLAAEGAHEEVVRYAREAMWVDPADFQVRRHLAEALRALARPGEAIEEHRRALSASRALPGEDVAREEGWVADLHLNLADLLLARGEGDDVAKAKESVDEALRIDWDNERARRLEVQVEERLARDGLAREGGGG